MALAASAERHRGGSQAVFGPALAALAVAFADAFLAALRVATSEVADAYDGRPGDFILGPPAEARAWRALREDGDAEHFVRVFGAAGEGALIERIGGVELPAAEFAAEAARCDEHRIDECRIDDQQLTGARGERDDDPPCFDWMTVPEVHQWRRTWVGACMDVAKYLAERANRDALAALARDVDPDTAEASAVNELGRADLLLLAAASAHPRGFAARDPALYTRIQAIRKRARRRAEKFSASVSE